MSMMQVQVPPNLPPHRKIVVAAPNGTRIEVVVPPNVAPGQMIQVQVPAAAAPPMQVIEVAIPEGVGPGQQIRVMAPSGQAIAVVVPPGVGPGQRMRVQVPAAPQQQPQPPAQPQSPAAAPPQQQQSLGRAPSEHVTEDEFEPDASTSEASARRTAEAAAAEQAAAAEREAEQAAAAAEAERAAAAAAAAAALSTEDQVALIVEQAAKAAEEAAKAAEAAEAAVTDAEAGAARAKASAEEASKAADVSPGPAAASARAATLAEEKVDAAREAAEAAGVAAKEAAAAAAAVAAAAGASSVEEVEGAAAAARGGAATARINKSKAEASAKYAAKAARTAAAELERAMDVAHKGAKKARDALEAEVLAALALEVALEAFAERAAQRAEEEADVHLSQDLGGEKALSTTGIQANRCVVCNDFTTNAASRGGKCLYCHNNPNQMVDGRPKALAAHYEHEERKLAAQARLQLAYAETPLSLVAAELRAAYDAAKHDTVGIVYIDFARAKLGKLDEKTKAAARLAEAVSKAQAAPGSAARAMLAEACADAARHGAPMGEVLDAQRRLHTLEKSAIFEAEAALEWLAAQTDLDADTLAAAAAAAEAKAGGKLDQSNRALVEARAALASAQRKHAEHELAAAAVLLASAPRPIDDSAAVDIALGHARQVGVDRGVGLRVGIKQAEPPALYFADVMQTNAAAIGVATAELERLKGEAADAAYVASEADVEVARREKFLATKTALAQAAADEVLSTEKDLKEREAVAKATFRRLHEKESVSFHHRNAVEAAFKAADDGWQRSLDLRVKYNDAEDDVRDATDALTRSGHAAAVVRSKAARKAQLLKWMQQEEKLLSDACAAQEARRLEHERQHGAAGGATDAPAAAAGGASEVEVATPPLPAADAEDDVAGCCACFAAPKPPKRTIGPYGGGAEMTTVGTGDVKLIPSRSAVPAPAHLDKGQGGNPLLELVDCFSWMPLRVDARRGDLLEALTASGAFDNVQVCDLIAAEMCAVDTGAAAALVEKLTSRLRTFPGLPAATEPRESLSEAGKPRAQLRWLHAARLVTNVNRAVGAPPAAPPPITLQPSNRAPIPDAVIAPVAECWLSKLAATRHPKRALLPVVKLLAGLDETRFVRSLRALLVYHAAAATTASADELEAVYQCVETMMEHSRRHSPPASTCVLEKRLIDVWYAPGVPEPRAALGAVATHYKKVLVAAEAEYARRAAAGARLAADDALERMIFALVAVFVCKLDDPLIVGFRSLVPAVFDVYLRRGSAARAQLSEMLRAAGFDAGLVRRIHDEDALVRQPFFWSAAGMKLFGDHPELRVSAKLHALVTEALEQEAMIVASFIELLVGRAEAAPATIEPAELRRMLHVSLQAMLAYVTATPLEAQPPGFAPRFNASVELMLYAASKHEKAVFRTLAGELGAQAGVAVALLETMATRLLPAVGVDADLDAADDDGGGAPVDAAAAAAVEAAEAAARAAPGSGVRGQGKAFETSVILGLAYLFIHSSAKLPAFRSLVPHVFSSHLLLGTAARDLLNAHLAFDPELAHLVSESDDLVCASFFWHGNVLPLFIKEQIDAAFPSMNARVLTRSDGRSRPLYPEMLDLLLRLNIRAAGGDGTEIAKRTREVLEQFERNQDQQIFLLTIFEKLDERTQQEVDLFDGIKLTLLTEVAQNGVHTLESVQGNALCERAMKTLLEGYIARRPPEEWSQLFKEAANVAYMVKYMFRESLPLAKQRFGGYIEDKNNFVRIPHAKKQLEVLTALIGATFGAYGDVGIFDPEKLAEIDFLNQPELLLQLVAEGVGAVSSDMTKMKEVTQNWMRYMISRNFPPLTPHHTQAFTVLMMSRFYGDYLKNAIDAPKQQGGGLFGLFTRPKLDLRAFIAQMATGEGKSIVIAMLAVFMVQLHGLHVHVLENNEGLLARDFATYKPFFEAFGISCGVDLLDADAQVVYCLKRDINQLFLRKMLEGKLDEVLGSTVIIVDEVDDLVVNENPNANYVKEDAERTPALRECFAALRKDDFALMPRSVHNPKYWEDAQKAVKDAKKKVDGVDYRVIVENGKKVAVILVDGAIPKVRRSEMWLSYLNYKLSGEPPVAQSPFATVCTPYVFNKYGGIFGLSGSVGGQAELYYLASTYGAVKFEVPRFLDTCTGDARKVVINHGVELVDGEPKLIGRVVQLCKQWVRKVPVLVITAGPDELLKVLTAVKECPGVEADEVQRFSLFDEHGRSLKDQWETLIADATKRLGGPSDNRCRVTVTDRFGGRGHDYQVMDKDANANGGMLVIATSVPDEREWIQWRGRTARQDRPGQFHVVLNRLVPPFSDHSGLADSLAGMASPDDRLARMLQVADEGIGASLKKYEVDQELGEQINELTEAFFQKFPRDYDAPWPSEEHREHDIRLRGLFEKVKEKKGCTVKDFQKLAKDELGIELSGGDTGFNIASLFRPKRQGELNSQVGAA